MSGHNKTVLLIVTAAFLFTILQAYAFAVQKNRFKIDIDFETGGINRISNIADKDGANFIIPSDGSLVRWQAREQAWGLGRLKINGRLSAWNKPEKFSGSINDGMTFEYKLPDLHLSVKRYYDRKGFFVEHYSFRNTSDVPVNLTDVSVFIPFNDNSPKDIQEIRKRCHAHIWAGGNSSYVNAIKKLGEDLCLGLVLTKGRIHGYELLNAGRGRSDYRGTISMIIEDSMLPPGHSYELEWKLFWHKGWKEFYEVAESEGFVRAQAQEYVVEQGDTVQVSFSGKDALLSNSQCLLNNTPIKGISTGSGVKLEFEADKEGENTVKLLYGEKVTWTKIYVIPSIKTLVRNRVDFIINKQQMKDKNDPRYGAYMIYDNQRDSIYKNDDKASSVDRDEGAERMAMGVLIARYLQKYPDNARLDSLLKYYDFVRNRLQTPDYRVFSDVTRKGRHRCYNYGWVIEFYVELYKVTKDKQHILDAYHTSIRYFKEFGYGKIIFRIPVLDILEALRDEGLLVEEKALMKEFEKYAETFRGDSRDYTEILTEVNFAIGGISAIVSFLEEMYLATNDDRYREGLQQHLDVAWRFEGDQPEYHLHKIAIRHWDGYWFGKSKTWGDTMPQWLTALSGYANFLHYRTTGKDEYLQRAKMISRGNLSVFKPDGKAYCTFLYPDRINGKAGHFLDPFANDQDWALVYYTLINKDW